MESSPTVAGKLLQEITDMMQRYVEEYDITYVEAVGVLDIAKARVHCAQWEETD